MKTEEIQLNISETLKALEESGDIVITTTTLTTVVNRLAKAVDRNVHSLLNEDEFRAVLNSLNVLAHDVKLDSRDFQSVIGIEKDDLRIVFDKLNKVL